MALTQIRRLLRGFVAARAGNMALITAITIVPVIIAAGAAVDYTRASKSRQELQLVIDAAALAAAAPTVATAQERTRIAHDFIAANMPSGINADIGDVAVSVNDDKVRVAIEATSPTTLMQIAHIDKVPLNAFTEVMLAKPIAAEIVFVLDYSLSMRPANRYPVMRNAVIATIDALTTDPRGPEIKFGLVPFAGQVYVPSLPADYFTGSTDPSRACTHDRGHPYNRTDEPPLAGNDDSKWHFGYSASQCAPYVNNDLAVQPLTTNYGALKSQMQAMAPVGYTHISLGMQFGWHLLSPKPPFTQATAYDNPKVRKFVVLLTDGMQTSPGSGPGNSNNVAQAEHNLAAICASMKDVGITIATVAFFLDHAPTKARLEQCATSSDYYFDAEDSGELVAAFNSITMKFAEQIRIAR